MTLTRATSARGRSATAKQRLMLSVGVSTSPVCGVRDYAQVVGQAVEGCGVSVASRWFEAGRRGPLELWRASRAWLDEITVDSRKLEPDSIVWHYSVFSYGYRGLPIVVPLFARALRATRVPVVTVAHEYVYPFGVRGARGALLASTQRAVLPAVVRASAALVVTTEDRREWLESRRWLPRRPVHVLPVPSNLPRTRASGPAPSDRLRLGLALGIFSFGAESIVPAPVASALRLLRSDGLDTTLVMIGAPGENSAQGVAWRHAARSEGVEDAISFTGVLEPRLLAEALDSVDVVLFADADGPSSRRGSLAAALAAGKPVVAFDGPATWTAAVAEGALVVAPATGVGLADALRAASDPTIRARMGLRAGEFYAAHQAPDVVARSLIEIVGETARSVERN